LSDQDSPEEGAGAGVKVGLGEGAVTDGDAGVVTGFGKDKGIVAIEVNKINSIVFCTNQ
jgi:hypothetical protein